MIAIPLKSKQEFDIDSEDSLILELVKTGWLSVLSQSALKVLIHFVYKQKNKQALFGDYDEIKSNTGLAKGSISTGLVELEAFGFICFKRFFKKTKLYNLSMNTVNIPSNWMVFLKKKLLKTTLITALSGEKLDVGTFNQLECELSNTSDDDIRHTLNRFLFLYKEQNCFDVYELMDNEYCRMEKEFDFTDNSMLKSDQIDTLNWKRILSEDEARDIYLVGVLEHYANVVDFPNRSDIDAIKKTLKVCYPYQIRNAITNAKRHPKYGPKFTGFPYIYKLVVRGTYGTRVKNNVKSRFPSIKSSNNQNNVGIKTAQKDRVDMIDFLDNQVDNLDGEAFDFDAFRNN